MTAFVVMDAAGNPTGSKTVFVRDRFAIVGFAAPVVWLAWHRLWLEAFAAFAATIGLTALGTFAGFQAAAPLLSILVSIFVANEGSQLRIWALERRGFVHVSTVEANNEAEAELRYFASEAATEPLEVAQAEKTAQKIPFGRSIAATPNPALGMLDYPGAR